jgi:hypothetical protein
VPAILDLAVGFLWCPVYLDYDDDGAQAEGAGAGGVVAGLRLGGRC